MDFIPLCEKFKRELGEIETSSSSILERARMAINLSHNLLQLLKSHIVRNGFENKIAEIHFFKNIKQVPLIPLIYYSEIRSFEIQFPKGNINCQTKYLIKKINKINGFFSHHLELGQYIESENTYFDIQYYTRDALDVYHIYSCEFYFQDSDFSTARDMLLSKYKAYEQLVVYLNTRLINLKPNATLTDTTKINSNKLIWPFTNTDWVELIYALSLAGIAQRNNIGINKISQKMEEVFDFEPNDLYKTYQNIKNRKNSRTAFLNMLTSSLISEMNNSEA